MIYLCEILHQIQTTGYTFHIFQSKPMLVQLLIYSMHIIHQIFILFFILCNPDSQIITVLIDCFLSVARSFSRLFNLLELVFELVNHSSLLLLLARVEHGQLFHISLKFSLHHHYFIDEEFLLSRFDGLIFL